MRVLPHVISGYRDGFDKLLNNILHNAILTHGHPRAIVGALCYSYALMYLFKKNDTLSFGELVSAVIEAQGEWGKYPDYADSEWLNAAERNHYSELWPRTITEMIKQLKHVANALSKGVLDSENETLTAIGCFDKSVNGAGDVVAITSIYIASKYANNPVLGIKLAANAIGADTDTIASMVGGLLGALMGLSWIPAEWKTIQDYNCLARMAEFLATENGIDMAKKYSAKVLSESHEWEKTPIGKLKKISSDTLQSGKTGTVTISKYVTLLGQTIYIKKMTRKKANEQHKYAEYAYQQPLTRKCVLRIDSQKINDYRKNTDLMAVSISQLCVAMELINAGTTDIKKIANETGISGKTTEVIVGLASAN